MVLGLVIAGLIIIFYMIMKKKHPANMFSDAYDGMVHAITRKYDKTFTSPDKLYESLVGYENDEITELTLNKLKKQEKLIQTNERRGKTSKSKRNAAATNAFMLGDIYRYNTMENAEDELERQQAREMAGDYYTRAIQRIGNHAVDTVIDNETANGPTVDAMIDRAQEFFATNEDLPVGMEIDFTNVRDNVRDARVQAYFGPAQPIRPPARRTEPARTVRKIKRKPNQTVKQNAQENFYAARNIRSDPQNVHETQVSNELERIYRHIQHENDKEEMITGGITNRRNLTISDIREAVQSHKGFSDEDTRQRALSVLNTMSTGNDISKLHDNETNVVTNVWKRIHSSDNTGNRENLRNSFMDALASGQELNHYGDYATVCANGRCGRIINSLTLMDNNETISKPLKTREIMKNEIFSKSYTILNNELMKASTDVAKAYNGATPESQIDDDLQRRLDQFEARVKDKIDSNIRDDYRDVDGTDAAALDNLIKDAQAGI
jgi:hypothetical protein